MNVDILAIGVHPDDIIALKSTNNFILFNKFISSIDKTIDNYLNKIKEDQLRNSKMMDFDKFYDFKYDVDGDGQVYPDVYDEFEPSEDKGKKKKDSGFDKKDFGI